MRVIRLRKALFGAIAAGGIVAIVLWQARVSRPSGASDAAALAEAVVALRRDDAGAARRVRRIARLQWPACRPLVQAMLNDPHWRLRASACAVLGDQGDRQAIGPLVSRCSDVDWRVRAAAAEALSQQHPMPAAQALRDMPVDQRDQHILDWLETLPADDDGRVADQLCEVFAGARHVEFSGVMANRCLACHAGPYPRPKTVGGACGACHEAIHQQWDHSAHANSLTHLTLPTPVDGQVRPMDFGDLRGMDCTACHRVTASRSAVPDGACPYSFADEAIEDVCGRCHGPTVEQWRAWQSGPQPRRAPWPPGHLEVRHGDDARDCADCHMAPDERVPVDARPVPAHHWRARRDPALLADGVALQVVQQAGGPEGTIVRLTMTNLAGHSYPTGSRRRGVHLYAGAVGAAMTPLLTLGPSGSGRVHTDAAPAQAPGDQRHVDLTVPPDTTEVYYLLVYDRDLDDGESYTADILSGCYRLSPWHMDSTAKEDR